MRVSLRWLKELLPGLDLTATQVAERLTSIGLAVDGISQPGRGLAPVILAKVLGREAHPTRSTLGLVDLELANGRTQRIVCGASNVPAAGGMVVLAQLGSVLPSLGVPLAPRAIGGIESCGMLCSEAELGVAQSSEGILVLPPGAAAPGTPLLEYFPELDDVIFELDVTPNRPDALGHVGVARDLAVALGLPFAMPSIPAAPEASGVTLDALVEVDNRATERCPSYGAAAALRVSLAPSPAPMRWRLERLGQRPISNVVDITNWLMLLYGHPMHAFDLAQVGSEGPAQLIIRQATAGEVMTTLDGIERKLDIDDLVIADAKGPTALAGVMGGASSEISATTERVLLECAYFTPQGVRRTARRHQMHTDSSHRFERGVDFGDLQQVLGHAQALLAELAGARAVAGTKLVGGVLPAQPTIRLRSARLDALLGVAVPFAEAVRILRGLGFAILSESASEVEVRAASHRPDVSIEADLIEEVARMRGLDAIPTVLPSITPQFQRGIGRLERDVIATAVSLGLSEALTYGFVAKESLERLGAPVPVVTLLNPLTEERGVMRTSLLPGLLEAQLRAHRRGEPSIRLFSLGGVFLPIGTARPETSQATRPREADDELALPVEMPYFAALLAGPRSSYLSKSEEHDVFDAKAIAVELVERVTRLATRLERANGAPGTLHLHPRGAARIFVGEQCVGHFGPLHPDVVESFELESPTMVVEIDLAVVEALGRPTPRYRPIPRLPAIVRDVSFVLPESLAAGDVLSLLRESAGPLCESAELFDLFRGGSLPPEHRALAFRLTYRDPKAATQPDQAKTLTDAEVDACQQAVIKSVNDRFGIGLRS